MTFGRDAPAAHEAPRRKLSLKKLDGPVDPIRLFSKLQEVYDDAYLLESVEGPARLARFSFLGFAPKLTVKAKDGTIEVADAEKNVHRRAPRDPLNVLKAILGQGCSSAGGTRFVGGAVGYVSYDAVRYWEKLPGSSVDDLGFPDVEMGLFDDGIVFDHKEGLAFYFHHGRDRFDELTALNKRQLDLEALSFTQPKVDIAEGLFEAAVEKAKGYVSAGDVFQVVLSKRYSLGFKGSLLGFYLALRSINPSPYMYFVKMGDRQLVGSSPEMLVRVEGGTVETYPIAGTRPRTGRAEEDRRLAEELLRDPKERAEHVMLVDLARNDVGKVSAFGSVHVPDFMEVHQYSHVQHIVSRVVGKLDARRDSFDALRALFPAGTVSGAPKPRAMEIIDESEPVRRGPYAGAVGYFSYNGNADFAITIRTLVADGQRAYIQVGAGIVADSVPEKEWLETEHKARGLFKALEAAGGQQP
ncbi:MAG: anthranilate synthase component I [Candidatus Bathyarchaeia archaeon]